MFLMLPYKLDHELGGTPWVTYSIAILSLLIYYTQAENTKQINQATTTFCNGEHFADFNYLLENQTVYEDPIEFCSLIIGAIHQSKIPYHLIEEIAAEEDAFKALTGEAANKKMEYILTLEYDNFKKDAPINLTTFLSYRAGSFNPFSSFMSAFAHADWLHVIGNLIFFLAFATAVEVFVGNPLKFILVLFALEVGLDFTWSIVNWNNLMATTLGLSGIVSGMIGMMGYILPRGYIRCFFVVLLVYFMRFSMPIWLLVLWFVGWDVYYLLSTEQSSTNYLAHVSGAIYGYLIAHIFFKRRKEELKENIDEGLVRYLNNKVDKVGRW